MLYLFGTVFRVCTSTDLRASWDVQTASAFATSVVRSKLRLLLGSALSVLLSAVLLVQLGRHATHRATNSQCSQASAPSGSSSSS